MKMRNDQHHYVPQVRDVTGAKLAALNIYNLHVCRADAAMAIERVSYHHPFPEPWPDGMVSWGEGLFIVQGSSLKSTPESKAQFWSWG